MASRRRALHTRSVALVRSLLQTMITLATASLGLVAALAWNEAIKTSIKTWFGTGEDLAALYTYAVFATVIAIAVVAILTWLSEKVGGEAVIDREAEG
jgi:Family of unknown function (DUF5654)